MVQFYGIIIQHYYGVIQHYYGVIQHYYGVIQHYYGVIQHYYGVIYCSAKWTGCADRQPAQTDSLRRQTGDGMLLRLTHQI